MGILLVYDVSDEKSFRNVSNWMRQIEANASPDVNTFLIGNKCDVPEEERASHSTCPTIAALDIIHFFLSACGGTFTYLLAGRTHVATSLVTPLFHVQISPRVAYGTYTHSSTQYLSQKYARIPSVFCALGNESNRRSNVSLASRIE